MTIREMTAVRENRYPILHDVLATLRNLKPYLYERWGVTELAVFGSVARGDAGIESDVDILFDYDRPLGLEFIALADFLEEKLGFDVDLLSKKAIRPRIWDFIRDEVRYV
jgi:predicted nucleotidyltransferase